MSGAGILLATKEDAVDEFVILLPDDEGAWERLGPAGQTGDPGGLVEACGLLASGSPVEVRRVARHNT